MLQTVQTTSMPMNNKLYYAKRTQAFKEAQQGIADAKNIAQAKLAHDSFTLCFKGPLARKIRKQLIDRHVEFIIADAQEIATCEELTQYMYRYEHHYAGRYSFEVRDAEARQALDDAFAKRMDELSKQATEATNEKTTT